MPVPKPEHALTVPPPSIFITLEAAWMTCGEWTGPEHKSEADKQTKTCCELIVAVVEGVKEHFEAIHMQHSYALLCPT